MAAVKSPTRRAEVAPSLSAAQAGIVTSALWSDVNRDGWIDLAAHAPSGGTVREFSSNQNGALVEAIANRPVSRGWTGWWNGITCWRSRRRWRHRLRGDELSGSTRSTMPRSQASPALLYYGDFDEPLVASNIIEAEYEDDILYPGARASSCSSLAIPLPRSEDLHHLQGTLPLRPRWKRSTRRRNSNRRAASKFSATTLESGHLFQRRAKGNGSVRLRFGTACRGIAQIVAIVRRRPSRDIRCTMGIRISVLAQNFYSTAAWRAAEDGREPLAGQLS